MAQSGRFRGLIRASVHWCTRGSETKVFAGSVRNQPGLRSLEPSVANGQGVYWTSIDKRRTPALQFSSRFFSLSLCTGSGCSFTGRRRDIDSCLAGESLVIGKKSGIAQSDGAGCYHLTIDSADACLVATLRRGNELPATSCDGAWYSRTGRWSTMPRWRTSTGMSPASPGCPSNQIHRSRNS